MPYLDGYAIRIWGVSNGEAVRRLLSGDARTFSACERGEIRELRGQEQWGSEEGQILQEVPGGIAGVVSGVAQFA